MFPAPWSGQTTTRKACRGAYEHPGRAEAPAIPHSTWPATIGQRRLSTEVLCRQQHLIPSDQPHRVRIPRPQGGAAPMPGHRGRLDRCHAVQPGAAQAEIDILQIGNEVLIQRADFVRTGRGGRRRRSSVRNGSNARCSKWRNRASPLHTARRRRRGRFRRKCRRLLVGIGGVQDFAGWRTMRPRLSAVARSFSSQPGRA